MMEAIMLVRSQNAQGAFPGSTLSEGSRQTSNRKEESNQNNREYETLPQGKQL